MVLMGKSDDGTNQRMISHVIRPLLEEDLTAREILGHKVLAEDSDKEIDNASNRTRPDPKRVPSGRRVRQERRQNPSVSGNSSQDSVLTVLTKE